MIAENSSVYNPTHISFHIKGICGWLYGYNTLQFIFECFHDTNKISCFSSPRSSRLYDIPFVSFIPRTPPTFLPINF